MRLITKALKHLLAQLLRQTVVASYFKSGQSLNMKQLEVADAILNDDIEQLNANDALLESHDYRDLRNELNRIGEEGPSTVDSLQHIFEFMSGQPDAKLIHWSAAKVLADLLIERCSDTDKPILCCLDQSITVAVALMIKHRSVDFHAETVFYQDIGKLLSVLSKTDPDKFGRFRVKLLPPIKPESNTYVFPTAYTYGFYPLPPVQTTQTTFVPATIYSLADFSVIVSPQVILWAARKDVVAFRRGLLAKNLLESITDLPQKFTTFLSTKYSMLVISREHREPIIYLNDLSNFKGWSDIHAGIFSDCPGSIQVNHIHDSNITLGVQRLLSQKKASNPILSPERCKPLKDLADIIRVQPVAKPKESGDKQLALTYREVAIADIDRTGVINRPGKTAKPTESMIKRVNQALLRPGDIIISVKGSIGKIGLMTEEYAYENFYASQTFAIIRLNQNGLESITPIYLLRYLKSTFMQEYFQTRSLGSYISMMKISDLAEIPVRIPCTDQLSEEEEKFTYQRDLLKQICELSKQLNELTMNEESFSMKETYHFQSD